jgi:hypothetical protein
MRCDGVARGSLPPALAGLLMDEQIVSQKVVRPRPPAGVIRPNRPQRGDMRHSRARVTNRPLLIDGVDRRTSAARRFRDVMANLVREHSGGEGVGTLSTVEFGLIRQAAAMTVQAEKLQTLVASGKRVKADELIRLSSEARRLMAALRRRKREPAATTTTLAQHLAEPAKRPRVEIADDDEPADRAAEGGAA